MFHFHPSCGITRLIHLCWSGLLPGFPWINFSIVIWAHFMIKGSYQIFHFWPSCGNTRLILYSCSELSSFLWTNYSVVIWAYFTIEGSYQIFYFRPNYSITWLIHLCWSSLLPSFPWINFSIVIWAYCMIKGSSFDHTTSDKMSHLIRCSTFDLLMVLPGLFTFLGVVYYLAH